MDRQTDGQGDSYIPPQTLFAGGIKSKNKYSFNDLIRVFKLNVVFCRPVLILKVQYFPLSGGKLSRISGRHLNYAGGHAGHQMKILVAKNKNLVAQTTILVDKIEPCVTLKLCRKWH